MCLWFGLELVITNMTQRILHNINEEYLTALSTFLLSVSSSSSSHPGTPFSVPMTPSLGGALETPGGFFPERGDPFAGTGLGTRSRGGGAGSLGNIFDLLGHRSWSVGPGAEMKGALSGGMGGHEPGSMTSSFTGSNASSTFATPTPSVPSSPSIHSNVALPTLHQQQQQQQRSSSVTTGRANNQSPQVTQILTEDFSKKSHNLKPLFIEAIQEVVDEVEEVWDAVGKDAMMHVHSGCVDLLFAFPLPQTPN